MKKKIICKSDKKFKKDLVKHIDKDSKEFKSQMKDDVKLKKKIKKMK